MQDLRKAIEYIRLEIRHWEEQEALTRSYVQEPVITPDRDPRYDAQFSTQPGPRPPSVSAGDMKLPWPAYVVDGQMPWRVPGPVTVLGEE